MATLYVTEQNAWVRKTSDRLVIEKDEQVLAEIPCTKLETVFVFGNVQVTTQALAELLDHGIELALFTMSGRLRGQLTPPKAKNVELRMRQYERARDEAFALGLARSIVAAKVANSIAVLRRFRENHPEAFSAAEVAELEASTLAVEKVGSLSSLLGIEGSAAARYFPLLARTVPLELRPARRERRPPPDPLNALLSFGYVLAGSELQALLDGMGFDPYIGFYHQLDYGRPSLALDLLEEFRAPLVDRLSATLLNRGQLQASDFTRNPEGGVRLTKEALKTYFQAWEQTLTEPLVLGDARLSYRHLFRRQAERLARAVRGEECYAGFRLPC